MMMKLKSNVKIFDLVMVFFLVYLSGNPIYRMIYFKESVIVFFVLAVGYYAYKSQLNNRKFKISKKELEVLIILLCLFISIVLTVMTNINNVSLSTYISIIIQLFSTYLISISINRNMFLAIYKKVIVFLAGSSLIFYALQILIPRIVYIFPQYNYANKIYSNAFIYNFMIFDDFGNHFLMTRNTGIFWEPGSFQVFLNLGIFFILSNAKSRKKYLDPKQVLGVFILLVTVITTKSTTGYITSFAIALAYFKYIFLSISKAFTKSQKRFSSFGILFLVLFTSYYLIYHFNLLSITTNTLRKISSQDYNEGKGWLDRLSLNKLSYLFTENKFHLFGISFDTLQNKYSYAKIWNSVLEDTIALGYIFSFILVIGYSKFISFYKWEGFIIMIVLFLGFSTEALFRSPFFLMLVFFGLLQNSGKISATSQMTSIV